jgi:hypothetical protein
VKRYSGYTGFFEIGSFLKNHATIRCGQQANGPTDRTYATDIALLLMLNSRLAEAEQP